METLTFAISLAILIPVGWSLFKPLDPTPKYIIIAVAAVLIVLNLLQVGGDYGWVNAVLAVLWVVVLVGNLSVVKEIQGLDRDHSDVV